LLTKTEVHNRSLIASLYMYHANLASFLCLIHQTIRPASRPTAAS